MILQYGNYKHRTGEVSLTVSKKVLRTGAQTAWAVQETWHVSGLLTSQQTTAALMQSDIAARSALLERAYLQDGLDARFLYTNGTVARELPSASSVGGVRVIQHPQFPDGKTVEMFSKRTFSLALEAIYSYPAGAMVTLAESFRETFQASPAGTRTGCVETRVGPPVRQTLTVQQKYRAVQSGEAVGKFAYPPVPAPLFPADVVNSENPPVLGPPKRIGDTLIDWPVSWRYEFESPYPLVSAPNQWGVTWVY